VSFTSSKTICTPSNKLLSSVRSQKEEQYEQCVRRFNSENGTAPMATAA